MREKIYQYIYQYAILIFNYNTIGLQPVADY
jgi:hypothetical protein